MQREHDKLKYCLCVAFLHQAHPEVMLMSSMANHTLGFSQVAGRDVTYKNSLKARSIRTKNGLHDERKRFQSKKQSNEQMFHALSS